MAEEETTFTWESFSDGCDEFRAKLREAVRDANLSIEDKKLWLKRNEDNDKLLYEQNKEFEILMLHGGRKPTEIEIEFKKSSINLSGPVGLKNYKKNKKGY